MSGHTPGPWAFGKSGKSTQHIDGGLGHRGQNWFGLAKVYVVVCGEPSATGLANARLIAAAPELLAELRIAANLLRGGGTDVAEAAAARAFAAIAKATQP